MLWGNPHDHVVLEGDMLERISPDPESFLTVLQAAGASDLVASFPNMGGDALGAVHIMQQAGTPTLASITREQVVAST
jgi:hypothetical protein